jgi:hypothetical protein
LLNFRFVSPQPSSIQFNPNIASTLQNKLLLLRTLG